MVHIQLAFERLFTNAAGPASKAVTLSNSTSDTIPVASSVLRTALQTNLGAVVIPPAPLASVVAEVELTIGNCELGGR